MMETCLFEGCSNFLSLWKKPCGVKIEIKPLWHNFSRSYLLFSILKLKFGHFVEFDSDHFCEFKG